MNDDIINYYVLTFRLISYSQHDCIMRILIMFSLE